VLAKDRRALICHGISHLTHGGSLAGLIERQTTERPYLIADYVPLAGDPGGLARNLSRYPQDTVTPTAATWLGRADASLFLSPSIQGGPHGKPANTGCGVRLRTAIDAGLYLGQPEDLTSSWWNPAIFLDPAYWKELQRRNALMTTMTPWLFLPSQGVPDPDHNPDAGSFRLSRERLRHRRHLCHSAESCRKGIRK
jgi:hypothetical protein